MTRNKEQWIELVGTALEQLAKDKGLETGSFSPDQLQAEVPPNPELGDLAFPMFPFARIFRSAPPAIAEAVIALLPEERRISVTTAGGYLNIRFDRTALVQETLKAVQEQGESYGSSKAGAGVRVMIEFSCPNTNKPLHLGHLRNDALGESTARILSFAGADVRKVNLINDRGVHICKSMLAYRTFGNGATPESAGLKSDHFVGDYYVRYNQWASEDPSAEPAAKDMLRAWEQGDPETLELWKLMNKWALDGIWETYKRTHVSFDSVYYESETYLLGKSEVLKGLASGAFYQDPDNAVWVDLSDIDLDKKVLLRSDGTSLYLTQDIGTAITRHNDWPFDRMVYVVASEQIYHFKVLFHVIKKLGHDWAENLHHLSYGMVNLPEGKMKSREGTVVDADKLLDELSELAAGEIREKEREEAVGDVRATADKIALGALHYYLLQTTPNKDMIFNPEASLAFSGNTGPYLQYTGARISSMLTKARAQGYTIGGEFDAAELNLDSEWDIVRRIAEFPSLVATAAVNYNPSALTSYLYELAKSFSGYYHDVPVLQAQTEAQRTARIALCVAVRQTLANGLQLIGVPFLESM